MTTPSFVRAGGGDWRPMGRLLHPIGPCPERVTVEIFGATMHGTWVGTFFDTLDPSEPTGWQRVVLDKPRWIDGVGPWRHVDVALTALTCHR